MSLGTFGCSLDEAFGPKSSKKKGKKLKIKDDNKLLNKILGRGDEVNTDKILPYGPINDSLSNIYDDQNETVKLQDKIKDLEQKNRDLEPNKWQHEKNQESMKVFDDIREQIRKLFDEIKDIKSSKQVEPPQHNTIETFANYNPSNKNITFDNDQFNELLLYIFTGIFLLILIDYIYKLGQKSF